MLQFEYLLRYKTVSKMQQWKFIDEQHCRSHSIAVTGVILCEWHQLAFLTGDGMFLSVASLCFCCGQRPFFRREHPRRRFFGRVLFFLVGSVLVDFLCR